MSPVLAAALGQTLSPPVPPPGPTVHSACEGNGNHGCFFHIYGNYPRVISVVVAYELAFSFV